MKKRWLNLYVENSIGVLAKISGLFSAKAYNLDSLTVGPTEDTTISRMTIGLTSDDKTFEQVKKQLGRCIEVIKVVDLTGLSIHQKELVFLTVHSCTPQEIDMLFKAAQVLELDILDCTGSAVLLLSVHSEATNDRIIERLGKAYKNRLTLSRSGPLAEKTLM